MHEELRQSVQVKVEGIWGLVDVSPDFRQMNAESTKKVTEQLQKGVMFFTGVGRRRGKSTRSQNGLHCLITKHGNDDGEFIVFDSLSRGQLVETVGRRLVDATSFYLEIGTKSFNNLINRLCQNFSADPFKYL